VVEAQQRLVNPEGKAADPAWRDGLRYPLFFLIDLDPSALGRGCPAAGAFTSRSGPSEGLWLLGVRGGPHRWLRDKEYK